MRKATCAGYSLSATHVSTEEKPHRSGVKRDQEGNGIDSRPCFRWDRRRGAWEVQSWLERELYESQRKHFTSQVYFLTGLATDVSKTDRGNAVRCRGRKDNTISKTSMFMVMVIGGPVEASEVRDAGVG